MVLTHLVSGLHNPVQAGAVVSSQLPKVGEWSRIEMTHERINDKCFLSLTVGGRHLGREDATNPELRKLTDVKVCCGNFQEEHCQPGFIRGLVVLEKQ